jgi:beta-mannosidase
MGSIYWQFNNDWQAPSWATLDYTGNWKPSHNMVRNLFSPVLLSPFFKAGQLNLWLVNDKPEVLKDAIVEIELFRYNQTTNAT